jgi:hypothetical protein
MFKSSFLIKGRPSGRPLGDFNGGICAHFYSSINAVAVFLQGANRCSRVRCSWVDIDFVRANAGQQAIKHDNETTPSLISTISRSFILDGAGTIVTATPQTIIMAVAAISLSVSESRCLGLKKLNAEVMAKNM